MGRSRTGTSEINRRKFVAKAKKSTTPAAAPQTAPQTATQAVPQASNNRVVQGSSSVNAAGLVVATPGAAARASGDKPMSSTIDGREIKVDHEGRMDLTEIAKMDVLSAGARGAVVPTEQMVGVVKDVAYGVASEDQRTMESGLDLILNPIMKPFVDERMKTEGVISEEWYWPEELKSNWKVLPGFMQPSDKVETRSFIEGASANVGNIGAIAQSPLAHKIAADEAAVSEQRFNTSSGTQAYYIGSALGEIPYFIIGAGQVKAVGTVAAKSTAGIVRGAGVVQTGKLMATAYKIERATEKLQKVANKADKVIDQSRILSRSEVLRAVKLLKDGYAINVRATTKTDGMSKAVKSEAKDVQKKLKFDSKTLNKFTVEKMNKIEAMPENTPTQKVRKKIKIDAFNADVQEHLLPDMRKFKDGYVAQAQKTASNTRVERLATAIGGSPKDMSRRMDNYFNKVRKDKGDTEKSNEQFFRDEMSVKEARGEFAGVMGNIKFNRHLFGNTMSSALGINRTQKKAGQIIELVQRTIPNVRIVTRDQYMGGRKAFEKHVVTKKKEVKELEMENKRLEKKFDDGKRSKYGPLEAPDDYDPEFIPDWHTDIAGEVKLDKPVKIKQRIAENKGAIDEINKEIDITEQTIKANDLKALKDVSFTKPKGKPKKGSKKKIREQKNVFRFDFEIYQKAYGAKVDDILPAEIIMASKPSVSARKVRGRWEGQSGDTPETSKSFIIDQIPRSQAQKIYGPDYVSSNPSIFKSIGFRKVGRWKTIVPKKAEPMEDIVYMYEATDAYRSAGFSKSGVKPVLVMNAGLDVRQQSLIKKEFGLDTFSGDPKVGQAVSGGKQRTILEYKQITAEHIKTIKQEGTAKMDGQDVGDILINRAELENRPADLDFFGELKIRAIEKEKFKLQKQFDKDMDIIGKNKKTKESTKINKRAETEVEYNVELASMVNRQKSLKKKIDTPWAERRQTEMNLQIHRTADQRGSVISFPLQILKRSSQSYKTRYESNMVRSKSTGKDYYISQAADGTSDYYEVLDDSFRPSMVSNTRNKAKKPKAWEKMSAKKKLEWVGKQVKLGTRETVYPKDIGDATRTPYRDTGLEETYTISVMEKGTQIRWVGNDHSTWSKTLKQYVPDGKWVDAKDPDYQMGLEFEDVMNKGILPKGTETPSKGFVVTNQKTGKVKWDEKPVETDSRGFEVGQNKQEGDIRVDGKKVNKNTVSYGLAEKMRENLIFLDKDVLINKDGKVVPYQGMLKKLTREESRVLESGTTIGTKQAKWDRMLANIDTTDQDLFLPGGRKLTPEEKGIWRSTGRLSADRDAPTYMMDYGRQTSGQLIKKNVSIVGARSVLKALEGAQGTRGKVKEGLLGKNLVPLEIKDITPDKTTYNQFKERDIGRIPYGDSVRTSGFEDNVAALFAVSQSDSMVQGTLPGGVRVTPIQEALPTTHIINEKELNLGQSSYGKGLSANKGSNYDKMLAQAKGIDARNFGGGTVELDFKKKMVEQIHTKIMKVDKPKADVMEDFLDPDSPAYSNLINTHVKTNNGNLKRLNRKESINLKARNKGRKVKKAVINPDDFTDILGKVNLDTRNPIKRLSDAFKYRTQYRTEPEIFKGGTNYTTDGKTTSQYRPSKTDNRTIIKQPSWFGKLATKIGDQRKDNYQTSENQNPFQMPALREVFKEPWIQQYIGTDKAITNLYDDVMRRGETWDEGGLQAIIRDQNDPQSIAKNVELNKLLGRLEAKQEALNKRAGVDEFVSPHQKVDRDRTTTSTGLLPKQNAYGTDWNKMTSKERALERQLDLDLDTLGPMIKSTDEYLNNITPKLNKAKEQKDVYGKMVSTGKMTSTDMYGRTTTRNLNKQEITDAKNNLKFAKEDIDKLTGELNNPEYLASLKKIKELKAKSKDKTASQSYTETTMNKVISTNTVKLGPDNPQWMVDANTNAKKIYIVKKEIEKGNIDIARQSANNDWGVDNRVFEFDGEDITKTDKPPRQHWGRKEDDEFDDFGNKITEALEPDADNDMSEVGWFNISTQTWNAPGIKDARLRLGTSDEGNKLKKSYIKGTKTDTKASPTIKSLGDAKDRTRSFLMQAVGVVPGAETSMSRRSANKGVINFMQETFEKSLQKQAKNVINSDDPVESLASYIAKPENQKRFDTPAFKKATEKLQVDQVVKAETDTKQFGPQPRVTAMNISKFTQDIRGEAKPNQVGLKQQAPLASSMATTVGNLFKPSETTATESDPFVFPSLDIKTPVAYAQEPNVLEQTIGDIKKTLGGMERGNEKIATSMDNMEVKSYEAPSSLLGVIGRMDMSRSDIQTSSGQTQAGLLDGLQIGQQHPQLESLLTTPITDQFLGQLQKQKQTEIYKTTFDVLPKPISSYQSIPVPMTRPKPIPQRVMPLAPAFPLYDPEDPRKNPRRRYGKSKKKKTWWQTPENWYEPYYWGGKDQMGAGYVTFTGKEPGKVKKYEKKFFGIGVNDAPFGVRSKWF